MANRIDLLEERRMALQLELDAKKTQTERNILGQFATPPALARQIAEYAVTLIPDSDKIRFLDPAIGTGAFYSALRSIVSTKRIAEAVGFEIDPHYGAPSRNLWNGSGLNIELADFTKKVASPRFNLIICNPPYVRHHHLEFDNKARLKQRTLDASGMQLSGLAGLYCHFLGLSHAWLADGGVAGWLVPSEFMDVNYGQGVKQYLLDQVTLLHVHRFDPNDVQFADALVSSAVIWIQKTPPSKNHKVAFTYAGSLRNPKHTLHIPGKVLSTEPKWTRFPEGAAGQERATATISDFFKIKRGLATGDNKFFILSDEDIKARKLPKEVFTPILPSPRYLPDDEITADHEGNPTIDRRIFLMDIKQTEDDVRRTFPSLHKYLEEGKAHGLHERYLCSHRTLWYAQENRPPPPIVCTYLGRSDADSLRKPFRFILNNSRATVPNVYLAMYPTPVLMRAMARNDGLIRRIWEILNQMTPDQLLREGRVYGGGLHKLEPKELGNVDATAIAHLIDGYRKPVSSKQLLMFGESAANSKAARVSLAD